MLEVRRARGPRRPARPLLPIILIVICACAALPGAAQARGNPLARRAMWIWQVRAIHDGNVARIVAGARYYGIGTVIVKSSDGTAFWSQFNRPLVSALHRAGLRVCAWQYVYGNHPVTEAYMGARAVHRGADCLIIDAETEYEGKYISAQTYIRRLRDLIGYHYPLALDGFPYVDYHPAFPYSVFLGPGGAQYNVPQMYWRDIGVSTDRVFAHTYAFNLPYKRRIFPLGQVFGNPPGHQIVRFRQLSRAYGAPNVSWWEWRQATARGWAAVARRAGALHGYVPYRAMADLGRRARGDLVVWAQEHLVSAGYPIKISGDFGYHTLLDVEAFQASHGLTVDGIIGPQTWGALLSYRTARVKWKAHGGQHAVVTSALRRGRRAAAGHRIASAAAVTAPLPWSASLPAKRDEIAGAGGAGQPG